MPVTIYTATTVGLEGKMIRVEVDISSGLPAFNIVGLADTAVLEARERVRSAIKNHGFTFPANRKTVSLAPSDVRKHGPAFDVPIAIGILAASKQVRAPDADTLLFGELALNGDLRPIPGIVPLMLLAKKHGIRSIILPEENAIDASIIRDIEIFPAKNLQEIVDHLNGKDPLPVFRYESESSDGVSIIPSSPNPFNGIIGQQKAKRALCIAAAGHHNILLSGSPGVGKTLLAHAMQHLLPPLTHEEFIEVASIHSLRNERLFAEDSPIAQWRRPIRQVHHTTSVAAIIGGTSNLLPGEISLAHRGVLILDEFPEFPRNILESLRQPLEDRHITVTRTAGSVRYPANFLLFATSNPCPCGFLGAPGKNKTCTCTPTTIKNYEKRISGPILDRIDLQVQMESVDSEQIVYHAGQKQAKNEYRHIWKQIIAVRALRPMPNSEIPTNELSTLCPLAPDARRVLINAANKFHMSTRGIHRTIKVARTIADLENAASSLISPESTIRKSHILEALGYRLLTS